MPAFIDPHSMPAPKGRIKLAIDFTDAEVMALAQLCKRFGYDDAARFSNRYDGGQERDDMRAAMNTLERALAQAGFAPR
jgi:hypothetical protein